MLPAKERDPNDGDEESFIAQRRQQYDDDDIKKPAASKTTSEHNEEEEEEDETSSLMDHALLKEDERYAILDSTLEQLGFGPFQYRILLLTGFGTFVDALEANLISILYPVFIREKFASTYMDLALVSSLQATGMLIGSLVLGILSDRLGRRFVYLISLSIVVLFGLVSSFAGDVVSFALLRMVLGFGYGGNNNTATSLMLELMPSNKRGLGAAVHSLNWGLGSLVIAAIAWIGGQQLDWRWLVRLPSLIALPVLVAVLWLPESPRFHVHNDDNLRVLESVQAIARSNGIRELPREMTLGTLDRAREKSRRQITHGSTALARACSSFNRLFSSRQYMILVLPLGLVWLLDGIGGTVITWLPLHATKVVVVGGPGGVKDQATVVYVAAFISASGIVLASLTAFLTGPRYRRQVIIRFGLAMSVGFTFGVAYALDLSTYYAMTFFVCFSHQLTNGALFLYTPEILPTNVRSTGFGFCLALFRVGSVFAPFVAAVLTDAHSFSVASSAFGGFFAGAFLVSFFMNVNTVNVPLKERAKM